MELSAQIKRETDPIYQKISKVVPEIEWAFHAPLIHKINMLKKEKKRLSLSEIFSHSVAYAFDTKTFEQKGIELVDNTSEEIKDKAIEMVENLEFKKKLNPEDEVLSTNHIYGALDRSWKYICKEKTAKFVTAEISIPIYSKKEFLECFLNA